MSESVLNATEILRDFMFKRVYLTKEAKGEEEKADRMITTMYGYFLKNPDALPETYLNLLDKCSGETVVCDYISSMTDRYAVYVFESLYVPKSFLLH